jgi:hypothetical protein
MAGGFVNPEALLRTTGLTVPTDRPLPDGLRPAAWGRSGHHWVFWFEDLGATALTDALERVRTYVNEAYPVPRPVRFLAIPKMVLVNVVEQPDEALETAVRNSGTSGWMGGESFALVAAVRSSGVLVFPVAKGNRNHRLVEQLRMSKLEADRFARAALL